jgi:hypothetical protein
MASEPYVIGGLAMLYGYLDAWLRGRRQHDDPVLRQFIRQYQRRALMIGKARAVAEIETHLATPRGTGGDPAAVEP